MLWSFAQANINQSQLLIQKARNQISMEMEEKRNTIHKDFFKSMQKKSVHEQKQLPCPFLRHDHLSTAPVPIRTSFCLVSYVGHCWTFVSESSESSTYIVSNKTRRLSKLPWVIVPSSANLSHLNPGLDRMVVQGKTCNGSPNSSTSWIAFIHHDFGRKCSTVQTFNSRFNATMNWILFGIQAEHPCKKLSAIDVPVVQYAGI